MNSFQVKENLTLWHVCYSLYISTPIQNLNDKLGDSQLLTKWNNSRFYAIVKLCSELDIPRTKLWQVMNKKVVHMWSYNGWGRWLKTNFNPTNIIKCTTWWDPFGMNFFQLNWEALRFKFFISLHNRRSWSTHGLPWFFFSMECGKLIVLLSLFVWYNRWVTCCGWKNYSSSLESESKFYVLQRLM